MCPVSSKQEKLNIAPVCPKVQKFDIVSIYIRYTKVSIGPVCLRAHTFDIVPIYMRATKVDIALVCSRTENRSSLPESPNL